MFNINTILILTWNFCSIGVYFYGARYGVPISPQNSLVMELPILPEASISYPSALKSISWSEGFQADEVIKGYQNTLGFTHQLQVELGIFDSSILNTDLSLNLAIQKDLITENQFIDYVNLNPYMLQNGHSTLNSIVSVDTVLQRIGNINDEIEILN